MSLVYLVRHGRPASSWGGADQDPGLDPAGEAQAEAIARRWLAPAAERPQLIVSSPLRRCRETAAPTAAALGLPVEIDPAVGEIPTPRNLPAAARPDWLRAAFAGSWSEIAGDLDYEAWRRDVTAAVARRPGAVIFSHYVAINVVVSTLAGDRRVLAFRPDHCSVTVLRAAAGALELVERGPEAQTGVL